MATTADYKLGSLTFPRGWFAMATTAELAAKPMPVRALGRDFVLYRTEDGAPVMLDAYCPHMGAHLASGGMSVAFARSRQVIGDRIACPLHGWQFDRSGVCRAIPYSSAPIPPGARVRSYPVRDHAGFVLAWYDQEGGEPEFEPAALPEFDDPRWLRGAITPHGEMPVHQAEIVDHHVDKVHIVTVHGQDQVREWVTRFDGHRMSQMSRHAQEPGEPSADAWSTYVSDYRGPGLMVMRVEGPVTMIVYSASTPVEDGSTMFWDGLLLRAAGDTPGDAEYEMMAALGPAIHHAFVEDHDILKRKLPTINPMLIPGDGPFRRVRTWYRQFFNPRADAAAFHRRTDGDVPTDGAVPTPWAAVAA